MTIHRSIAAAFGAGFSAFADRGLLRMRISIMQALRSAARWRSHRRRFRSGSQRRWKRSSAPSRCATLKARPVQAGPATLARDNAAQLRVPLKALSPGTYKVIWRVLSVDTHRTQGDFTFRVGP